MLKAVLRKGADSTTDDEDLMRHGIADHRRQAKSQMSREMGLSA